LKDIRNRGISRVVNLGDTVYGPLDPAGTAEILIDLNIPTVSGNEDIMIVEANEESHSSPTLDFVRSSLSSSQMEWIKSLPMTTLAYDTFLMFHGTPEQDDEYLLQVITKEGVHLRKSEKLQQKLASTTQKVILCGHDHTPGSAMLSDGRLIVNPGSVGLPAYTDDSPFPHIMETGTPHARHTIITRIKNEWEIEDIATPYDWIAAADTAQKNGRLDWAKWLKTGRA